MRFTPEDCYERQPLISRDCQRVLVSNGRLDNRPELMPELGIAPSEVSTTPDSEFVLRAYERWGEDCPRHLVGAFTFAVWDSRARRLFLARLAIASPPLFYHATRQALAFATMPKGLFALGTVPRRMDEEFLASYLARLPRESDASFYLGIRRLLPGYMLVADREGVRTAQYWQPDLARELHYPRDEDYVAAFLELFERVVADHLRSITPVGVMMSGGFDSTAIAATGARLLAREGKMLPTFTEVPRAGFDGNLPRGRYADETPLVKAMAREHENLESHLIHTEGGVYVDGLDKFFQAAEVPFRNASNRVWYEAILGAAEQKGVRVLLDGGQGNLTISWGGDGLIAQLVRSGRFGRAWREASGIAKQGGSRSAARAMLGRGILPLLPDSLYLVVEGLRKGKEGMSESSSDIYAHSPIHPDLAREHRVEERARSTENQVRSRSHADTRGIRLRTILATSGAADGLDIGYNALYGVSGRDPTSDVRIVEFCLSLPEEQYQRDGQTRWLLTRAMADRLPAEVLENRKRGLQAADWFERLKSAQTRILDELVLIEQCEPARRAIDLPRLRRLVEQMPEAHGDADRLFSDYRGVLEMGLMTGCFIRWFESARAISAG